MKTNIHFCSYLAQFFWEWKVFQSNVVENIKTRVTCSVTFFPVILFLWDNVEKYGRAGQTTDDNMAHAHYMLDA